MVVRRKKLLKVGRREDAVESIFSTEDGRGVANCPTTTAQVNKSVTEVQGSACFAASRHATLGLHASTPSRSPSLLLVLVLGLGLPLARRRKLLAAAAIRSRTRMAAAIRRGSASVWRGNNRGGCLMGLT